eukprot:UC4_evm1s1315
MFFPIVCLIALEYGALPQGMVASVYMQPSGLGVGSASWRSNNEKCVHGGLFANSTWWSQYLKVRNNDVRLLKESTGISSIPAVIIHFWNFLADVEVWGPTPLERLDEVVRHFNDSGIHPIIFIGSPEFSGSGCWAATHDVVRNSSARSYLKSNIQRTLQIDSVRKHVLYTTVYWMGGSDFCNGHDNHFPICEESEITKYNNDLASVVHNAGMQFLIHVDGPFWDGCYPQPCHDWNIGGYSPNSLKVSQMDGLMAESWCQGSLLGGANMLIEDGVVTGESLLLLNDIPNCDIDNTTKCSTGSLINDTALWFSWIERLGVKSWGYWDLFDGGIGDPNGYGDGLNDGSGLTQKGKLHAKYGSQYLDHSGQTIPPILFLCRDTGETVAFLPVITAIISSHISGSNSIFVLALTDNAADLVRSSTIGLDVYVLRLWDLGVRLRNHTDLDRGEKLNNSELMAITASPIIKHCPVIISGIVSQAQLQLSFAFNDRRVIGYQDGFSPWSNDSLSAVAIRGDAVSELLVTSESVAIKARFHTTLLIRVVGDPSLGTWGKDSTVDQRIIDRLCPIKGPRLLFYGGYGGLQYNESLKFLADTVRSGALSQFSCLLLTPHPGQGGNGSVERSLLPSKSFIIVQPSIATSAQLTLAVNASASVDSTCGVLSLSLGIPSAYINPLPNPYRDITGLIPVLQTPSAVRSWVQSLAFSGFRPINKSIIYDRTGIPKNSTSLFVDAIANHNQ